MYKGFVRCNTKAHRVINRMDEEHKQAAMYEIERQGLPKAFIDPSLPLSTLLWDLFRFYGSHEGEQYWLDYYEQLLKQGK